MPYFASPKDLNAAKREREREREREKERERWRRKTLCAHMDSQSPEGASAIPNRLFGFLLVTFFFFSLSTF